MEVDNTNVDSVYLLIVSNQTFSSDEKHNTLNQINSSLNQIGAPILNRKDELLSVLRNQHFDASNIDQEYRTEYKNGSDFDFQFLVNSKYSTFKEALQDFFKSTFKRKYLILTTFDYNSYGDIHLQDCVFTYDDFVIVASDEQVKRATKENKLSKTIAYLNGKLIENNKNWKHLEKSLGIELVGLKPMARSNEDLNEVASFFSNYFNDSPLDQLMEVSKLTGTLRIVKPSLYIFPGRVGDSAFFTINGFSMLVNGGYERVRPCFWKFVTMLQQIDSVLITHTDSDALGGLSSLFAKKLANPDVKPTILTVLGNLIASKSIPEVVNGGDSNGKAAEAAANLIVNEVESKSSAASHLSDVDLILDAIDKLKIKLMPLVKNVDNLSSRMNQSGGGGHSSSKYEHINLYFKLGQGSLDLYVLSPFSNSADYKEFVSQQQNRFTKNVHQKSQLSVQQYFRSVPLSHVASAVCLIVWLPAPHTGGNTRNSTENNALRLLFTGNAPQHVIFNALDKVKDFDVLTSPIYRQKVVGHSEAPHTDQKAHANGVKKPSNGAPLASSSSSNGTNNNKVAPVSKPVATNGNHEPVQSKTNPRQSNAHAGAGTGANKEGVASSLIQTKADSKPVAAKPPKSTSNLHSLANNAANANSNNAKKEAAAATTTEKVVDTKKPAASSLKSNAATVSSSNLKKDDKPVKETSKSAHAANAAASKPAGAKPVSASSTTTTSQSKPAKPQSAAAAAGSKDATKKTLASGKPSADQKKEVKDESKIITKRDKPKEVKPTTPTVGAVAAAAASSLTESTPVLHSKDEMRSVAMASVAVSTYVETVVPEPSQQEHVAEAVDDEPEPEHGTEHVVETVEEVISNEEAVIDTNYVRIEESLGKSLDMNNSLPLTDSASAAAAASANYNQEEEVARSLDRNNTNELIYNNESPNLSPVKKDMHSNSAVNVGHHNNNEDVYGSLQNGHANGGDHHHHHQEQELNGEHLLTTAVNGVYDVMTTSFIEDSSNPESNPFNGLPSSAATVTRKIDLNESENDLNKTHQLSDEEGGGDENGVEREDGELEELEEGEIADFVVEPQQSIINLKQQSIDTDALASVLESLNIDNGSDRVHISNATSNVNDPNSWSLLQLPKPVNPSDVGTTTPVSSSLAPASAAAASGPILTEKKSTPNGKKSISSQQMSPLADVSNKAVNRNQSSSSSSLKPAVKSAPVNPVYLEVSYVPAHGNGHYCDVEFFKRVRARHYVLSSEEMSEHTLNAVIDGKESWEDKSLLVSIIPTYESDLIRTWYTANQDKLDRLKIDVMPAANMGTVTLDENPELSCQALKIEF